MFSICKIMSHEFYIGLVKTRMTVAPASSRAQLITSALQLETPPLGSLQSYLVNTLAPCERPEQPRAIMSLLA